MSDPTFPTHDYIDRAESDSGFYMSVWCPKCEGDHHVTVSRIGRFVYECRSSIVSGAVEKWAQETESRRIPKPPIISATS